MILFLSMLLGCENASRLAALRRLCLAISSCDSVADVLSQLDPVLRSFLRLESVHLLLKGSSGDQDRLYHCRQSYSISDAARRFGFKEQLVRYLRHLNTLLETVNPVIAVNGASACILVPLLSSKRTLGAILIHCLPSTSLTPDLSLALQEISLLAMPYIERAWLLENEVRRRTQAPHLVELQRLGAIYDGTNEYIGLLSPNGTLLETNRASLSFHEEPLSGLLGSLFWETPWFRYTPGSEEQIWKAVGRAAKGNFLHWIFPLQRADGDLVTFDYSLSPIRNEAGDVTYIVPEARIVALTPNSRSTPYRSRSSSRTGPPAKQATPSGTVPLNHLPGVIGDSPAMKKVMEQAIRAASVDVPVFLFGEKGTGKERIARAIHNLGQRSSGRFIRLDCANTDSAFWQSGSLVTMVSSLFESAEHGTVYLDDVGELPFNTQSQLLRILLDSSCAVAEAGAPCAVRWIASASTTLSHKVLSGQFRADLFNTLNVFPIDIPSLSQRREDIPPLVCYFAAKYARRTGKSIDRIPDEVMRTLSQAEWRANVRELEDVVEKAVNASTDCTLVLPPPGEPCRASNKPENHAAPAVTLEKLEREHIQRVLLEVQGQVSKASMLLGINRSTLNSRLRRLGIQPSDLKTIRRAFRQERRSQRANRQSEPSLSEQA